MDAHRCGNSDGGGIGMKWQKYDVGCEMNVMGAEIYIGLIYAKPDRAPVHAHHHSFLEIQFQREGTIDFMMDFRETVRVSGGEWILLGKGVYHEESVSEHSAGYIVRVDIRSAEKDSPFEEWRRAAWIKGAFDSELRRILEQIFAEADEDRPGSADIVKSLCTVLLVRMIRQTSAADSLPRRRHSHSADDRTIIDEYFDGVFRQDGRQLSIGELAGMMRFSTRQVSRILQNDYGMTFSQKLRATRMKLAEHLLLHTDLPLKQIGAQCGISVPYLNRCFRAQYGVLPLRFRAENSIQNETDR